MEEHGAALFYIGNFGVTSIMTTMLGITLLLTLVCWRGTRHMKERPSGLQNVLEKTVEMLDNFISDIMGKDLCRRCFPYLATLFIFILISNYSGLLPFAGKLPGLSAPTSSLSVTATLAICTFAYTHYMGVRSNGLLGYAKHFISPFAFLLPLLLMDEFVRPLSLSLRLYGNTFGDEEVTTQLFHLVPYLVPLVMNALTLLMGFIQAMVFVLLSSIYISGASGEGH
ncbi:MAG: F0F1 ATP synthase subunit A [Firmicutes bacterium]|nr:F0F1 ATP synthase subunit A [Bacillota bacterium]